MKLLTVVLIIAATIIASKWIDVGVKRPEPTVHVDTLRVVTTVYDTVTVVSRAADTVRIMVKNVGPLTEKDLVGLICGSDRSFGDVRDEFKFNAYGMVFCPADPK